MKGNKPTVKLNENMNLKKQILIVFILIVTKIGFGQSDTNIVKLISITDNSFFPELRIELDSFKNSFPKENIEGNLRFYTNLEKNRYYGIDICEYNLNFYKIFDVNGGSFRSELYNITILFDINDSTIFYNKFVRYIDDYPNQIETPLVLKYDSTRLESYFARHDSLFNCTTVRNFKVPPFISDKYYGPLCPNHGSILYEDMLSAVRNKRKDILLSWINSFNMEDKAYGATGLYFMKLDGVVLKESEQLLIETVRNMMAQVRTDIDYTNIYTLLNESRLDKRYKEYKNE